MFKQKNRQALSLAAQRKRFFLSRFKYVMVSFASSIKGIADEAIRHSYASLVVDRFFVLFFLQQHGLLDNNTRYLQHHLNIMHTKQADTFFADFFLPLCHTLLSEQAIPDKNYPFFGHIPLLAHPLFQQHAIEVQRQLHISDEALHELFCFLEAYRWELISRTDLEPDAVHHTIFADLLEQRSNQKQTGTYYTTDDVTDYVAKNTILPALFQRIQKRHPKMTHPHSAIWQRLIHSPNHYIPAALQDPDTLPEETPQEYQLRRKRYASLISLLQQGTIQTINDMVTYNLDVLRFTIDIISTQQELELLVTLFTELEQLTILDPTCGSGAFLFAAFSLLQTLYMTCLQRMQALIANETHTALSTTDAKDALARVHSIQADIAATPNISYFVVYHIITYNLYGVDLMDEAIRVCTLRFYLTLLAQTQRIEDVPPFHQVSIHMKTGNALVGEVYSTQGKTLPVSTATTAGANPAITYEDSEHTNNITEPAPFDYKKTIIFHWDVAFPEVARYGGFAVIIGNPPYIEHSKIRHLYTINGYEEKSCGNLYAAILERSLALSDSRGSYIGLVLPLSICGSQRFAQLRVLLTQSLSPLWLANFDIFPSRLLGNAFQRLSLLLAQHTVAAPSPNQLYTTRIHRWYPEERPFLIDLLTYTQQPQPTSEQLPLFPKLASPLHAEILQKIMTRSNGHTIGTIQQGNKTLHFVYYQEATNYWIKAVCHIPFYQKNGTVMVPPHGRFLFFDDAQTAQAVMAIMNSSLFYLWFATYSDGFHLAHTLATSFPLSQEILIGRGQAPSLRSPFLNLADTLEADLLAHTHLSTRNTQQSGKSEPKDCHTIELTEYQVGYSKSIIDQIDRLLAHYYDFTMDELDFIIHYEIKYRMGRGEDKRRISLSSHD